MANEPIDVESIKYKSLREDGSITLTSVDSIGNERIIRFKDSTHVDLLQTLLPRGPGSLGHPHRVFSAEQVELINLPSGDLGLRFLLSGGIAMTIGLSGDAVHVLREELNRIPLERLQ